MDETQLAQCVARLVGERDGQRARAGATGESAPVGETAMSWPETSPTPVNGDTHRREPLRAIWPRAIRDREGEHVILMLSVALANAGMHARTQERKFSLISLSSGSDSTRDLFLLWGSTGQGERHAPAL